jgi:hypothetical protein
MPVPPADTEERVMTHTHKDRVGGLRMPRSRGAVSGLLLVILGVWGALIPFVGPHFNFAYTPDQVWTWTTARGWLEVFPGVATAAGGLLLFVSGNRAIAMLGGWLAVLGGGWFVVGGQLAPVLRLGAVGDPVATTERKRALLEVTYFSGLGALIVFLGGIALARLVVRLARDGVPPEPQDAPVAATSVPGESARVGSVPVAEPYRSAGDQSLEPVSSSAITQPRMGNLAPESSQAEPRRRGSFRRQGAGAGAAGRPYPQ